MKNECFIKNGKNSEIEDVNKKKELLMDELNGVFFTQKEVNLNLKTLPFIENYRLEINQEASNKFYVTFSDDELIKFYKNSLLPFPFWKK